MNATQAHAPVKKDPYSFSLRKIIQDVEERTGRKFSGPEDFQSSSSRRPAVVHGPEVECGRRTEPRYPRATRQLNLEGEPGASGDSGVFGASGAACDGSSDHGDSTKGAGRAQGFRSAPAPMEHASARRDNIPSGPEHSAPPKGCDISHVSVVLSLLPQIPGISDEAFLFLYLNVSADFERRFGIQGWYDRVLTMAAQGRK